MSTTSGVPIYIIKNGFTSCHGWMTPYLRTISHVRNKQNIACLTLKNSVKPSGFVSRSVSKLFKSDSQVIEAIPPPLMPIYISQHHLYRKALPVEFTDCFAVMVRLISFPHKILFFIYAISIMKQYRTKAPQLKFPAYYLTFTGTII